MSVKNIIIKLVSKLPFGIRSKIKNIPIIKQVQSWVMKKWVNNESFIAAITGGPAKGLVFPVQMPQDKLMWIGTWELEFAEALQHNVKAGWVCYDIGAYKGYYAGVMALKGASQVYIFEPMPANAAMINELISLNKNLPLHIKQMAVSDTVGKASFKLMPEETMGKLNSSSFQEGEIEMEQLTVDCITLDELIKNGTPEPDFIKIDVEGAEEFVLKGAIDLLKRKKPFLMIEVHSPEIGKRCLEILDNIYENVKVLETGLHPSKGTPEICHYVISNA
jgi:FkbM family methyltransferase